jgi:urease accessory protein
MMPTAIDTLPVTMEKDSQCWPAHLKLRYTVSGSKTVLREQRHFGPLMVQKPFYPEGLQTCHSYLIHPPGGVVGGDKLGIEINSAPGAHAVVTTPGATKFYRSAGPRATQINRLTVSSAGALEWLPQETIIYNQADVKSHTIVSLQPGAEFIGWEIVCLGLPASRQPFRCGILDQRLTVWQDDRPLLIEPLRIEGKDEVLDANWGLAARPVTGIFIATLTDNDVLGAVRQCAAQMEAGNYFGATRINGLTVCRFLGQDVGTGFKAFRKAWEIIRPAVLDKKACAPRIWAT